MSMNHNSNTKDTQSPLRVLIIVSKRNSLWSELWDATEKYLPQAISILQEQGHLKYSTDLPYRLLLKKKLHLRIFIVFDICNQNYDAVTGNLPSQNRLPVAIVQYGKGHRVFASAATPDIERRVNYETGEIHNLTGMGSLPPFVVDITTAVPYYLNPRDSSLLNQETIIT